MTPDDIKSAKGDIQEMLLETRLAVKTILAVLADPDKHPNIQVKISAALVKELVQALNQLRTIYREMQDELEHESELSAESELEKELDACFNPPEIPHY